MSAMEHIFMQIFERRDWIAGQLRQQGESFSQSVASNLLAAGGLLPPWLWTSATGSDCWNPVLRQELNREQIISGILYTFPRATTPISHTVFSGKPLQKDANVPQSKSFVSEKCVTTPFSVPNWYPGDNECRDIVMDSLDVVQKFSLEQRDKPFSLGKKRKLTDGLSKESVTEYTGRITRSRATSMKTYHVKESLDLRNLSGFPIEFDDTLTQQKPAIQQLDSFKKSLNLTKQIDCTRDSSKQRVSDPRIFSCSVQPVNMQRDTCNNNDTYETGRQSCSVAGLELSSGAHQLSLPLPCLDITNSAASLPSSGNNSPAQACLDGIVNNEHEDAHSRAKAAVFTSSAEICCNVEPRQLVSDGVEDWPLSGNFDTALGKGNQCTSSKIDNSRLEPLESLFGELVSKDSGKADNSLLSAELASDSMVANSNSPSELNIVDNMISTLPHVAAYVETEPALSNIKDRASNEKFDMRLDIQHQNTSPKAAVIKSDTTFSGSKFGNSRLEPLESLFGELVSQDSGKAGNSLFKVKLASDLVVADSKAPSELNIVDDMTSTHPHVAASVEIEPALSNIKATSPNEKFDMCLEIEHQNISLKAAVIKTDTAQSTYGDPSVGNCIGEDNSSMDAELQVKLHAAEALKEEDKAETVVHADQEKKCAESPEVEKPEIRYSPPCHETPPRCVHQNEEPEAAENDFCLERNDDRRSSSLLQLMQGKSSLDCHVGPQEDRDSTSSMDELEINGSANSPLVSKEPVTAEHAQHLESTHSEQIMNKSKSNDKSNFQLLLSSTGASQSADRELVIPDEAIPELEGFSIESPVMGNEFTFDDPNLQKLTRERASALEQLRRSMNVSTPFSCFSIKHRIHRVPDVCQSLPGELLKCMGWDDHLQSSGTDGNELGAAKNDNLKDGNLSHIHWKTVINFDSSLFEKSGSHSSPFSGTQFFHNITRGPFTPPVEKFPQTVFLERKGCGSDRIVSNPELTCFRIDEHARSLEENVCREEYQERSMERLSSREKGFSSNRKALTDVTSIYQNATTIGSTVEKNLDHNILGSVERVLSFPSEMNDNKNLRNGCGSHTRSKVENKENDFLSASRNKVQKAVLSVHNRLSKVSMKAGEQKRSQAILEKKASNIVSSISSFVPLVQQKQQAAAPITGKREIKVKALKTAEFAKRQEAKRENERKMRREAARLERMKPEQEKPRQLELKQKQKEEEKKKRETNIAARKRQRAEEERKERQRKRNCTEGTQRRRKDYEEKVCAKAKELQHKAEEEEGCKRKVLPEETGMEHKAEKGKNVAKGAKFVEMDQDRTNIPGDIQNVNNSLSLQYCGAPKVSKTSHKVIGSSSELQQTTQGINVTLKENRPSQSYEISPYQDSDDEDGEDNKKLKKKFVPSWARRESLDEHLLSMRHLDPTKIFCRKRSFDLTEVLSFRTRQRAF